MPGLRRHLINVQLDSPAGHLANGISPVALQAVELSAARLAEDYVEHEVSADDLQALSKELDELFKFVANSQVEDELRIIALDLIQALRQAVAEYQIRGINGLERAMEEAAGKLFVYYGRHNRDVPEPEAYARVWRVVLQTEAVIARAVAYAPYLKEFVERFLLGVG